MQAVCFQRTDVILSPVPARPDTIGPIRKAHLVMAPPRNEQGRSQILCERPRLATDGKPRGSVLGCDVLVNAGGGAATGDHRRHHQVWTGHIITAREYAGA